MVEAKKDQKDRLAPIPYKRRKPDFEPDEVTFKYKREETKITKEIETDQAGKKTRKEIETIEYKTKGDTIEDVFTIQ